MKAIIWDVDGTLLNSSKGLHATFEYTIEKLQLSPPEDNNYDRFIGLKPQNIFIDYFNASEEDAQKATDVFREFYKTQMHNATLYEGIIEVLAEFQKRGYKQAVATNKRRDLAIEVCKRFDIEKYFETIWGPNANGDQDKGDLIKKCLDDMKITNKSRALMIGDTFIDQEGARINEISFLPVHYGFGNVPSTQKILQPIDILKYVK